MPVHVRRTPSARKNARRASRSGRFREIDIPRSDWLRLALLPWHLPFDEWSSPQVNLLSIRKGESRHSVLFVEIERRRYAIKETSPLAASHEIASFRTIQQRHCRTLDPVGFLVLRGKPIPAGTVANQIVYESGDIGYCITRLAERVLPQSLLYRYPFTETNKRLLWNAIAELLLELHEHGVYWGDPSLANVLMDLSGHRLTAIMADAETAEVRAGPLNEGLRQQDLEMFIESLIWQAEDIRLARGLPEDQQLVTESDSDYFLSRYEGLRAERTNATNAGQFASSFGNLLGSLSEITERMQRLNDLGYGVVQLGTQYVRSGLDNIEHGIESLAIPHRANEEQDTPSTANPPVANIQIATLRPGWYVRRLRDLLGVHVPPEPAQRIYQAINVHKWLLSERAGHDVGMEATIRDWRQHYHQPLLNLLTNLYPHATTAVIYEAYAAILEHTWQMSEQQQRALSLEEGALDYLLAQALVE